MRYLLFKRIQVKKTTSSHTIEEGLRRLEDAAHQSSQIIFLFRKRIYGYYHKNMLF